MPGLNLRFTSSAAAPPADAAGPSIDRAAPGAPGTSRATLFRDNHLALGATTYPGYPLETFEDDRVFVCLEGRIAGMDPRQTMDGLRTAGRDAPGDRDAAARAIRRQVENRDGDFVVLHYEKAAHRLIVADPVGGLPLYGRAEDTGLVIARDQGFALSLAASRTPDRLGLAHLLMFGYALGARTLAAGVERLPGARMWNADRDGARFETFDDDVPDLTDKARASFPARRNAAELAELFVDACRERVTTGGRPLVALSGGLDSRAVGAALRRAGVPFDAATFADAGGQYASEIPVARRVAEALGAPWSEFHVPAPRGDRLQGLLRLKYGLNTLAMAFSLDFFGLLHATYGAARTLWSGDGGDKVMPDHRPRLSRAQAADIAGYVIEKNQVWPLEQVARLTGLETREIEADVREVIEAYRETDPAQVYVRFMLRERARRWILEGEDTNRSFYWTAAPFRSRAFVRAAMACPDTQKSGHRLYRLFMQHLDRAAAGIVDVNIGLPLTSPLYVWNRRLRETTRRYPALQRLLRPERGASVLRPAQALQGRLLAQQAESSPAVRAAFSADAIRDVGRSPERFSPHAIECLLTATCAAEQIATGQSALDAYAASVFG